MKIDLADLLFFAGLLLLLIVAFHFGLWIGLAMMAIYLIIGGRELAKMKARSPHASRSK